MAKKPQTQTGARAIQAIFADAQRAIEDAAPTNSMDPHEKRNGILPGKWDGAPFSAMPPDSPVKVVGRSAEGLVYCISTTGHLRRVERWDMTTLADLFAPDSNFMYWAWPAFGKKAVKVVDEESGEEKQFYRIERVEREKASMCLINEAARKPDFDPYTQHRGRGGWQDSAGRFIWHSGGWLWSVDGRPGSTKLVRSRPAVHDGYLYTRQPATIEPWASPVSAEESPALRILEDLRTWNWQRPYLDPILVLGWIATALLGGALKARPIIFASGGAGVGKSRLQEVVSSALHGAVTMTVNTTAAGIYQRAKQDSLPFMVDELESKAGSSRAESVIELARVAYTGGDISRGGQDHEATTFTARNSFFFSAIIPPPMGPQDKTRMAMLNLGPIERAGKSGRDIVLKPDTDGRMILRQLMDGWSDLQNRSLPDYANILQEAGLSARAIDTYGTLLAAAELLVGPGAMEDVGLPITEARRLGEMIADATAIDRTENLEHWHKALDLLFQSTIEAWRDGQKPTVGSVVDQVLRNLMEISHARDRLQLVNLGILDRGKAAPNAGPCLAVPAGGPALTRMFADTDFHKGGWYTALKQAPRDVVVGSRKVKINGSTVHCQLVDLAAFDRFTGSVKD